MSTRSVISRKTKTGFQGIYCHSDGYPSWNGEILLNHYADDTKVSQLISLGSLSILYPECGLPEGQEHNFNNRIEGYTVAYHRDRGESWDSCKPKYIRPFRENWGQEYEYLWDGSQWLVSALMYPENKFLYIFPLREVFAYSEETGISVDNSEIFRGIRSKELMNLSEVCISAYLQTTDKNGVDH